MLTAQPWFPGPSKDSIVLYNQSCIFIFTVVECFPVIQSGWRSYAKPFDLSPWQSLQLELMATDGQISLWPGGES